MDFVALFLFADVC